MLCRQHLLRIHFCHSFFLLSRFRSGVLLPHIPSSVTSASSILFFHLPIHLWKFFHLLLWVLLLLELRALFFLWNLYAHSLCAWHFCLIWFCFLSSGSAVSFAACEFHAFLPA